MQTEQTAWVPPPELLEPLLPLAEVAVPEAEPEELMVSPEEPVEALVVAELPPLVDAWVLPEPEDDPDELELLDPPKVQALSAASPTNASHRKCVDILIPPKNGATIPEKVSPRCDRRTGALGLFVGKRRETDPTPP